MYSCLQGSALAVGKERMGQDALTLVQLLGSIQRTFCIASYKGSATPADRF